jgi:hypothetical protein
MSKTKKVLFSLGLAGAVGLTYLVSSLKGMPDLFDLEDDDE